MTVQRTASDPYELQRPRLISFAYQILGSINEAERTVNRRIPLSAHMKG